MIRVKIIHDNGQYKAGQILTLEPNVAFGLIDSGNAEVSKDFVYDDYSAKRSKKPGKIVKK